MKLSQDQIENIIELHSAGMTDRWISKYTGHSRGSVTRYTDSRYLAEIIVLYGFETAGIVYRKQREVNLYKNLTYIFGFIGTIAIILNFI